MSMHSGYWHRFLLWCPGAVGLLLRQRYLAGHFGSCGRGVLFGRNLSLTAPGKIHLGDRVIINNNAVLDAGNTHADGTILLEEDVFIGAATKLSLGTTGSISIKRGANLSSVCNITANYRRLVIGSDCLVAAYCTIGDNTSTVEQNAQQVICQPNADQDTLIDQGCWLGVRARITEGIHIGRDSIIGAHAVVVDTIPPYAVAVGQPAKVVKDRKRMAETGGPDNTSE